MVTEFEKMMTKKTVEELMEYINNFERYSSWALTAVVNELKVRETIFSDEEFKSLYERIEKKKEIEEEGDFFRSSKSLKKNVVTDPNAPLLYSKIAVSSFSIFFTVIFGAILLAINIENKMNKIKVIGFGVLFTTLAMLIGNLILHSTLYVLAINAVGAYFLSTDFWNKYIGREIKYRAKPTWIPLIISIIIAALLLISMLYE